MSPDQQTPVKSITRQEMKTIEELYQELKDVDVNFADWSESDKESLKRTIRDMISYRKSSKDANPESNDKIKEIPALEKRLGESVVKWHKRGLRRYFPIKAKDLHSWAAYFETFEIICGRKATDQGEVGAAILFHGLDSYIERFGSKLYVRTVYKVDWEMKAPPLLKF